MFSNIGEQNHAKIRAALVHNGAGAGAGDVSFADYN